MFKYIFIILAVVACSDASKKKSSGADSLKDGSIADQLVVPTKKLAMYHPACGRGDPMERTCQDGEILNWEDSHGTKKCSELGLSLNNPCDEDGLKCIDKAAVKCKDGSAAKSFLYLLCLKEKPSSDMAGCPVSRAETKTEISYLSTDKKNKLASEILNVKLATYEYKPGQGDGLTGQQLGFIINDNPDSVMVMNGQRVNLYAYISAVVATVQAQQKKIEALEKELQSLKKK